MAVPAIDERAREWRDERARRLVAERDDTSSAPECVSEYTIHTVANRVSHVPIKEMP